MSTITENDLKELKIHIENQLDELEKKVDTKLEKLDGKLDRLIEVVNNLRVDISALKTETNVNNKRLENNDFIIRTIFVGIVTAILLGVFKFLCPLFPNA